ncbi:MAG: thioredoxin family protein [Chitinophagaceae bacterium]|nr:thioredoxin family protein [Chitinophagaceae bacterium]
MKKYIYSLLFLNMAATGLFAQAQYEASQDLPNHPGVKVVRGLVNKYLIQNDTAFAWYGQSQSYYKPDTATLNAFERAKGKYQFVVFGGTWCEDTQFVLPKFFKIQEASGIADDDITLYGVNRAKMSLGNIAKAFNVTLVPTIIIMKDGKEIDRVVEYGKTGKWDKELAAILNK